MQISFFDGKMVTRVHESSALTPVKMYSMFDTSYHSKYSSYFLMLYIFLLNNIAVVWRMNCP